MIQSPKWRQGVAAVALMAVVWPQSPGFAQVASAPVQGVPESITTVAPVTVTPMAPVPEVGTGATYFYPEELADKAREARRQVIEYRSAARECGVPAGGPSLEAFGVFSAGAMYDSIRRAEYDKQKAAEHAKAATEAAMAARVAALQGQTAQLEATELARQRAILEYQRQEAIALEAHRRLADGQDRSNLGRNPFDTGMRVMIDNRTFERTRNSAVTGITGLYIPMAYEDLRLTEILAKHVDQGEPSIALSGRIVNTRKRAIDVPPLWIAVVDKYGTALKLEQIQAPARTKRIPAGGSVTFNYTVKETPLRTARAVVTFAPYHRLPEEMPVTVSCGSAGPMSIWGSRHGADLRATMGSFTAFYR